MKKLLAFLSLFILFFTMNNLMAQKQPNVLVIIADDLNDYIGCMGGHSQALTPNLDQLAQNGIMFTNAHVSEPWCAPSRATIWTGLNPVTSGYHGRGHWREHPVFSNTVPMMEYFKKNGYRVYGTGKIFHNRQEDMSVYHEYKHPTDYGPYAYDGKKGRKHPALNALFETHYCKNLPDLFDPPHMLTFGPLSNIPEYAPDKENGIPGYEGWYTQWGTWGKPFRYVNENDRDLTPDELSTEWAIEVLERQHDKPFFLCLGLIRPHVPLYAPKKYFDKFPLDGIELPTYLSNDIYDLPYIMLQKEKQGWQNFRLLYAAGGEQMWKRWVQAYLACVLFIDDMVGKVLETLAKSPYADNTIVIFTSDHGFHNGEKDWCHKNTLWEKSTRVPLLIKGTGFGSVNRQCDHPVSLVDLYPTLIDLCGLPENPNAGGNGYLLDGHSLRPFLENPETDNWKGPSAALTTLGGKHFSIRTRQWRYTLYDNGEEELYNHENDPNEWHNQAGKVDKANIQSKLKSQLLRLAKLN